MKIMNSLATVSFLLIFLSGCVQEAEKPAPSTKKAVKVIPQPFRYHKAVEVRPGLTLDVVSWGRGSESVGGYLILRSDSTRLSYRSVAGELDGKIVDVWDMDLDSDGNPELYIHAKGEGEGSYLNMYIYEYNEGGSNQQIRFPELSGSLKKGYKGADSVYVKDGKLMRQFPLHHEDDSLSGPSGKTRILEYSLRSNTLSSRDVSEKEEK